MDRAPGLGREPFKPVAATGSRVYGDAAGPQCAGLGGVVLDPREGLAHCGIVNTDDPLVAANKRRQGNRLRGGEGEIAAGPVIDIALPVLAAEPAAGAVGNLSREDVGEDIGIDRALQAQALASRWAGSSLA